MAKLSSLYFAFHSLKIAKEYFTDISREHPNVSAGRISKMCVSKIDWIFNNIYTNAALPKQIIEELRSQLESDSLAIPEIMLKIVMLTGEQREALEFVINQLLDGQSLKVEIDNEQHINNNG